MSPGRNTNWGGGGGGGGINMEKITTGENKPEGKTFF